MNSPTLHWSWLDSMMSDNADGDQAKSLAAPKQLTLFGIWLFLIGIAVFGSASRAFRIEVGGLLVHPFLFPVGAIAPLMLLTRLPHFPVKVLAGMAAMTVAFLASALTVSEPAPQWGEIARLLASIVSIITIALCVRSERDLVLGTLGLIVAVGLMAFTALQEEGSSEGAIRNVLDTGNKNAYSMYALPAILVAGYVVVNIRNTSWLVKGPMIGATLLSLVAIFTSQNRSGYLGAAVIAALLFWRKKGMGLVVVTGVTIGLYYILTNVTGTAVLEKRLEETREGLRSDDLRKALFYTSFQLGLESPVLGVSPQKLPWVLGERTESEFGWSYIDPHNVFGYIVGGSGMICLAAFLYCGWCLWKFQPRNRTNQKPSAEFVGARHLMRILLILYVLRGMFSREILYNPGFVIAIGLAVGWCIVNGESRGDATPDDAPGDDAIPYGAIHYDIALPAT